MSRAKEQSQPLYEQRSFDLAEFKRPARRLYTTQELYDLHRALEPFVDVRQLRQFVAEAQDMYQALRVDTPPKELRALLETITAVLRPVEREQVKSPRDIAALLMVEMGYLDQEEMRAVLLDTRNRLQGIVTVYRGSLNMAMVRVGELFKEALRRECFFEKLHGSD